MFDWNSEPATTIAPTTGYKFVLDEDTPVDPMPSDSPSEEKRQQRMRDCGVRHVCYNDATGSYQARPFYCHDRECEFCNNLRLLEGRETLVRAMAAANKRALPLYRARVPLAEWKAFVKAQGIAGKGDYLRIPQTDDTAIVFFVSTAPLSTAQLETVTTDDIITYDIATIMDTPYERRDGHGAKLSGNLGAKPSKPKVEGVVVDIEDAFITDENDQPITDEVIEDINLQVVAETINLIPTTVEEHVSYQQTIQQIFFRIIAERKLKARKILHKQTFSIDTTSISASWLAYRKLMAPKAVSRGYLAAIPPNLCN